LGELHNESLSASRGEVGPGANKELESIADGSEERVGSLGSGRYNGEARGQVVNGVKGESEEGVRAVVEVRHLGKVITVEDIGLQWVGFECVPVADLARSEGRRFVTGEPAGRDIAFLTSRC
jgi:hypothetical protein